jgi:hypothetical protein
MLIKQPVQFALLGTLVALQLLSTSAGAQEIIFPFNPSNFSNPTQINNRWLPMVPGMEIVLQGQANRGGGFRLHRVIFTVTDLTKVINGVRTVVVLDRDISNTELVEVELAFFAQDNEGNVWNLGEYPEEFKRGEFLGAPNTWIAGVEGAKAGVHMLADPRVGGPRYLQGEAPAIKFLDTAKVLRTNERISVLAGSFRDVVVTDETSPLEGAGHQLKFHAPGVGIVKVEALGDPEAETLIAVHRQLLSPALLERARKEALGLDSRGYQVSPNVYGKTPPVEHPTLRLQHVSRP